MVLGPDGAELGRFVAALSATQLADVLDIAELACFYSERVDRYVDGAKQERPRTPSS